MKKLLLSFAVILIAACNKNNTEEPATVGEWYATEMAGKSFKLGDQENIDLIKQAGKYYNAMDAKNLAAMFSETAKIYAHTGEMLEVSEGLYNDYFASLDSLFWDPKGISTQTLEDDSIAVASIPSDDSRYFKDGTVEKALLFERFWIVDGKIQTIVQYKREVGKNYEEFKF